MRKNYFEPEFVAQYVRVHPTEWEDHISMRWDLGACPDKVLLIFIFAPFKKIYFCFLQKQFTTYWNKNDVRKNYFEPEFVAQYVRVHPIQWEDHISMRWDLGACPGNILNCLHPCP